LFQVPQNFGRSGSGHRSASVRFSPLAAWRVARPEMILWIIAD
jgi:hypothetical protein